MTSRHGHGRARTGWLLAPLLLLASVAVSVGAAAPASAAAPARLMAIGDSITAGDDGDFTWRYRLAQHLTQAGAAVDFVGDHSGPSKGSYAVSGWDGDHQAVWGMPAWKQRAETQEAVARHIPDYIVLHIGTNDLALGQPAIVAVDDVGEIIKGARAARPSVRFLLVQIIPRLDTANALTVDFNTRLAALATSVSTAQSPVAVTDAYTGFSADHDLYDGTHPNRVGEYKIAAAVAGGLWRSYGVGGDHGAIPPVGPGPDAPAGVTATGEDGAATVSWSPVRTATSYNVHSRNLSEGQTQFSLVQFGVTGTSWRQTMLFNGQVIEYQVRAVRWFDESPASANARVTPAAPRPPSPGNVRTVSSGTSVTVSWDAVGGSDSYSVYSRDATTGGQFQLVQFGVTRTSWTQIWLTSGHTYEYAVTSTYHGTEGHRSAASAVEVEPPPGVPQNVRADAGNGTVTISWSAVGGATSYLVYGRDATAGHPFQRVQWDIRGTSWTHQLLANGNRYEYYVTALNGGSESAASVAVGATPFAPVPPAPTNVTASAAGGSITIRWSAVPGAASYTVYGRNRSTGESAYQAVQWDVRGTGWTHQYLTPGHVHEYYVTAVSGAESNPSNVVSVMAGGPRPAAPAGLNASPGDHQVRLSWTAVAAAESYTVYGRDETAGEAWHPVQWGLTGTGWTHTILTNGHRYAYYVTATRGGLQGGASPVASAVPVQPPPAAPKLFVHPEEDQVFLDWNDSGDPNMAYWIYYRPVPLGGSPGPWDRITLPAVEGKNGTAYRFPKGVLQSGREYEFHVGAVNGGGETGSNVVRATPRKTKWRTYVDLTEPDGFAQARWDIGKNDQSLYRHYNFNWSDDGCSTVDDAPEGFNFLRACQRHDFGYRNHRSVGLSSEQNRERIDMTFWMDMRRECGQHPNRYDRCIYFANAYYAGVRNFGRGPWDSA